MKAEDFKNLAVTNRFGQKVIINEIKGNIASTGKGIINPYHIAKLFYRGHSVFEWLNESEQ